MTAAVLAAGGLCWRMRGDKLRVLIIHRDGHGDVSLPKGKVEPGETLPETAVREIAEETGLTVGLGAPLGEVTYPLPSGRQKIVYYWSAEVDPHALESARFTPDAEVSAVEWVSLKKARARLSYPHDLEILEKFAARWEAGRARTFAIILLRHGKAMPPSSWDGPDRTRPLLNFGTEQAESIAQGLAAYRPERISSSTAARCLATVAPVARITGLEVKESDGISQDAFERGESQVHDVLVKRLARGKTVLLCSHGPLLPEFVEELARLTNTPPATEFLSSADLETGEYSVLHVAVEHPLSGIVALETHSPTNE